MNEQVSSTKSWHEAAAKVVFRTRAFIDGKFVDAVDGRTFAAIDPATGRILANVAACAEKDVDIAVKAARRVFDAGSWSRLDPSRRGKVLKRFADLILANQEELALLETLNMGKLIMDSATLDVPSTAEVFRWFGEACDKLLDEVVPVGEGCFAMVTREPAGVVGAVVPWNFPLKMAAWKCAPALAAGNSVVLKPAEQSPLSALRLAELASEAGIPDGVLNVLPGLGHEAGKAIGMHGDIDVAAFTGSTEVGKYFLNYSAQSNMKRVWLECGGKSATLIFPTAKDVGAAARGAAQGIYFNQGEVCSATSRLLVHRSAYDQVVETLLDTVKRYQPGDPLAATSGMGALVSEEQMNRVLDYIELGKKSSTLLHGGNRVLAETGGYFVEPTIFTDVRPDAEISTDEIFGPVLSITTFEDEDEAVRMANSSVYGLGASVWTSDLGQAHRLSKCLHVGSVSVNCVDMVDVRTPFGGVKQSGSGRDLSVHALDKYTDLKTTWMNF